MALYATCSAWAVLVAPVQAIELMLVAIGVLNVCVVATSGFGPDVVEKVTSAIVSNPSLNMFTKLIASCCMVGQAFVPTGGDPIDPERSSTNTTNVLRREDCAAACSVALFRPKNRMKYRGMETV